VLEEIQEEVLVERSVWGIAEGAHDGSDQRGTVARRFVAELPNECWQADVTHVTLENGVVFEVLNVIDDHSRLCVASRAMVRVKAQDVIRVLHKSAEKWGLSGGVFVRQRSHLHRPGPIRTGRGLRAGAVRPGHPLEALPSLPSGGFKGSTQFLGEPVNLWLTEEVAKWESHI